MKPKSKLSLTGALCILILTHCSQAGDQQHTGIEIVQSGIQIEHAQARPAGEGRIGAAYFSITNNNSEADTLLSVSSDIAELVEIHESYELENGMMGMREAEALPIPAGAGLALEPGGLHIMLIRLTKQLEEGDEFELTLHFAQTGEETITVAVQQM